MSNPIIRTVFAAGIATAALVGSAACGQAVADPAAAAAPTSAASTPAASTAPTSTAPSSCRPANHQGTVAADAPSAGHRHYRVTLTAAPGTDACTLAGSPVDVSFSKGDTPLGVSAAPYGDQTAPVAFGPGAPVHFDVQVPNGVGPAQADHVDFTLQGVGGVIPGGSAASGPLGVDAGTQVGPIQPGA